jgi:type I restriction enzyme, S subunit
VTNELYMPQLPKNWIRTRLDCIAEVVLGQSPPSSTYNESGKGLPFYQGKLEFGKIHPTPKKWCFEPKKIAEKGDVLISVRAPVGPTNISPEKSCIGRGLAAIRGLGGIETLFILYTLRAFENVLIGKGTGTTFSAISGEQLRSLEIPLPPVNEQRRIVCKIEELFSFLDVGTESLRKVQTQLKRYRQAVLKHALEGNLTEEWRRKHKFQLESAQTLLDRIRKDKMDFEKGKNKETPISEITTLSKLPDLWVWTRLGNIISVHSGEGLTKNQMKQNGDYPVYGGNGVSGYYTKYLLEESKVIIGRVGAKCGVIHITPPKSWITDNALIVNSWNIDLKFLAYSLSILNLNRFSVSTAQPVISSTKIYSLLFKLPPLEEQKEIVKEIEFRLSVSDEIQETIAHNLLKEASLRQSILKTAFAGNLVPQLSNDEPSEKLLERIKAERLDKINS